MMNIITEGKCFFRKFIGCSFGRIGTVKVLNNHLGFIEVNAQDSVGRSDSLGWEREISTLPLRARLALVLVRCQRLSNLCEENAKRA